MATHLSLRELGVGPGDITPIGALDTTPPPGQPLQTLNEHLGPAAVTPAPIVQRGWDSIFKAPGMGG